MAIKPIRNSDSTCAIYWQDPAINQDDFNAEKVGEYARLRARNPACFRELVPVKSGERLTVFEIGVVPADVMVRINDECPLLERKASDGSMVQTLSEEMRWRCFLHGVRNIDPWEGKIDKRKVNDVEYVTPDWMKANFARGLMQCAMDIGAQIYRWNMLTEEEAKN